MIDLDAARRGDENVSTPADLARLVLAFHRGEGLSALVEGRRARDPAEVQADAHPNRRACRASSSPARAASWKACAPTPASSTSRPAVCVRRDGDVPARRRGAVERARTARATQLRVLQPPGHGERVRTGRFGRPGLEDERLRPETASRTKKGRSSVYPMPARYEAIGRARVVNACDGKPGMRRCQRLPELRIPVTRRDRTTQLQASCRSAVLGVSLGKHRDLPRSSDVPVRGRLLSEVNSRRSVSTPRDTDRFPTARRAGCSRTTLPAWPRRSG